MDTLFKHLARPLSSGELVAGTVRALKLRVPTRHATNSGVARKMAAIQAAVDKVLRDYQADTTPAPANLAELVAAQLDGSTEPWDKVIWQIAQQHGKDR